MATDGATAPAASASADGSRERQALQVAASSVDGHLSGQREKPDHDLSAL